MNKEEVLQLWLDAEEENRKPTQTSLEINKCIDLKVQFSNEYKKLSNEDKEHVVKSPKLKIPTDKLKLFLIQMDICTELNHLKV